MFGGDRGRGVDHAFVDAEVPSESTIRIDAVKTVRAADIYHGLVRMHGRRALRRAAQQKAPQQIVRLRANCGGGANQRRTTTCRKNKSFLLGHSDHFRTICTAFSNHFWIVFKPCVGRFEPFLHDFAWFSRRFCVFFGIVVVVIIVLVVVAAIVVGGVPPPPPAAEKNRE